MGNQLYSTGEDTNWNIYSITSDQVDTLAQNYDVKLYYKMTGAVPNI